MPAAEVHTQGGVGIAARLFRRDVPPGARAVPGSRSVGAGRHIVLAVGTSRGMPRQKFAARPH